MSPHPCACGCISDRPLRPVYAVITRWGPVRIVRCRRCRLAQADDPPTPEEASALYDDRSIYAPPEASAWDELVTAFRHVAEDLQRAGLPRGKILEVGCHAGYALQALRQKGYDVSGVERNHACAQFARQRGLAVWSALAEIPLGARFDAVLLSHVIEHIVDLHLFLQGLRSVSGPNAMLYIKTPNFGSFFARCVLRGRAPCFLPRQHVWYFEKSTLTDLLQAHGLVPLQVFTRGFAFARSRTLLKRSARAAIGVVERALDAGQEIVGLYRWTPEGAADRGLSPCRTR